MNPESSVVGAIIELNDHAKEGGNDDVEVDIPVPDPRTILWEKFRTLICK